MCAERWYAVRCAKVPSLPQPPRLWLPFRPLWVHRRLFGARAWKIIFPDQSVLGFPLWLPFVPPWVWPLPGRISQGSQGSAEKKVLESPRQFSAHSTSWNMGWGLTTKKEMKMVCAESLCSSCYFVFRTSPRIFFFHVSHLSGNLFVFLLDPWDGGLRCPFRVRTTPQGRGHWVQWRPFAAHRVDEGRGKIN